MSSIFFTYSLWYGPTLASTLLSTWGLQVNKQPNNCDWKVAELWLDRILWLFHYPNEPCSFWTTDKRTETEIFCVKSPKFTVAKHYCVFMWDPNTHNKRWSRLKFFRSGVLEATKAPEHHHGDSAKTEFWKEINDPLLYLELWHLLFCSQKCLLLRFLLFQLRCPWTFYWLISKPVDELSVNSVWTAWVRVVRIRVDGPLPCV